jgi:hypothetical protein
MVFSLELEDDFFGMESVETPEFDCNIQIGREKYDLFFPIEVCTPFAVERICNIVRREIVYGNSVALIRMISATELP